MSDDRRRRSRLQQHRVAACLGAEARVVKLWGMGFKGQSPEIRGQKPEEEAPALWPGAVAFCHLTSVLCHLRFACLGLGTGATFERLGPLGCTGCPASTCGLSTWWSTTALDETWFGGGFPA